ncbi:hypothetical protein MRX96_041141 [Rhipicephalus microplus]
MFLVALHSQRHLGQQTLLKEHVEKVVKKIRYMGKYHFKNNNCQKLCTSTLNPPSSPHSGGIVGIGVSLLLGVVFRVHS